MPPGDGSGPARVLLGNLEPVVRLGMTTVLEEEDGIEVVGSEDRPHALVLLARRLRPDAVVLDLGQATSRDLADRVQAAAPAAKVVLWARDEDAMEVLDPGGRTPRRFYTALSDELRCELIRSQVNRVEE